MPRDSARTEGPAKIFTVHEEDEVDYKKNETPTKLPAYTKVKQRRRSENQALKQRSKNYKADPNISVCSTPTVENKLIHEDLLSICSGKIDPKNAMASVPDLVQDVLRAKPEADKMISYSSLRRTSLDDQMIDLTYKTFPMPLK